MPTKIVLREDAQQSNGTIGSGDTRRRRTTEQEFRNRPSFVETPTSNSQRPSMQRSLSVNFRSALRRDDDSIRNDMSTDIRASPRLMSYLSCGLASTVMLVSVMQFYQQDDDQFNVMVFRRMLLNETTSNNNATDGDVDGDGKPDAVFGSTVLEPKLIASVAVASAGMLIVYS